MRVKTKRASKPDRSKFWKQLLGPGLVTGASDDDPSGIATYAQAGTQFGYALAWTLLLTYPLMSAVQAISARIGRTTGHGVAGNLRRYYSNALLQVMVVLLFAANTLNIGADLGAMAEAGRLLIPPVPAGAYILLFGLVCTAGPVFLKHRRYVSILQWITLSLLSYFAALLMVRVQWTELVRGLVWPQVSSSPQLWMMVVAVFGTTISPYLFFWQASQEAEDTKAIPARAPLRQKPSQAAGAFARIHVDTLVGMALSNLVALAIMITAAATLHRSGLQNIETAAQAADALRPIAGNFAFALFALGIVGTGLLAVPVLAGSAAYAVGEARNWPVGLARAPLQAKAFYATITAAVLLGALSNRLSLSPMTALVWVAVINGVIAVPVMILLMMMARDRRIMGQFRIPPVLSAIGWAATTVMAFSALAFILSLAHLL